MDYLAIPYLNTPDPLLPRTDSGAAVSLPAYKVNLLSRMKYGIWDSKVQLFSGEDNPHAPTAHGSRNLGFFFILPVLVVDYPAK